MHFFIAIILSVFALKANAYTKSELSFYFGPSISQSGNIQDLGDPDFNTAFEYNYYFKKNHGMGVSFGNEYDFDGGTKFPTIRDASIHTWDLHYSFRYRPENSRLQLVFSPGVGIQTIYDESQDYYWGFTYYDDLSSAWVLNYKLMATYMISEWKSESSGNDRNFFLGAGVTQIFSFDDRYKGKDISGSRFSGLFQLGFGF